MTHKLYFVSGTQKDGILKIQFQGVFNLFPLFPFLETLKNPLKKKTITEVSRLRNFANKNYFFLYTTQAQGLKI